MFATFLSGKTAGNDRLKLIQIITAAMNTFNPLPSIWQWLIS
jgi:hypothetical protein